MNTKTRVVVTGMGVVAPNGVGTENFAEALFAGRSGIRQQNSMIEAKLGCQVAGTPQGTEELCEKIFAADELLAMNANHRYACLAAVEAWQDAGFALPERDSDEVDWNTGAIMGTGIGGMDTIAEKVVPLTNAGRAKRLGSTVVEQVMASGTSARAAGLFALGNKVSTNSSACSTGTEAIIDGLHRIRSGQALRMLCGGSEGDSHYIWSGFDAMRVLARHHNDNPELASRPMSASAAGFVPASGAGMLMLESLDSAQARSATIHGEILGGHINCGGHRGGGSMTAPNPSSVRRCIHAALNNAAISANEIDAINGHLTATMADPREVNAWAQALNRPREQFPYITSTKSMIGHGLGAAGAMESIASLLMLKHARIHPSINSEDVHPEIVAYQHAMPQNSVDCPGLRTIAKSSFGFGDVNAVVIFRAWPNAN
ncbi:MAG: beta-ketoacyl-[acyl-carrier-protein] synthase family protein [Oceanococcus sp.]|nr:MAG: beta-ketoacyl-[acyl-carrier-protein] synthase family protein [Oceanococcus sp.]